MNFTATIPNTLIQSIFSDFEFMKSDQGWVRSVIKSSLDEFLENEDMVEALVIEKNLYADYLNEFSSSKGKCKITLSCAGQSKISMGNLIKKFQMVPAEITRLIFAKISKDLLDRPEKANELKQNIQIDPFFKKWIEQSPGKSIRVEQAQFYNYMGDTVQQCKVGLIEASTGTGKSVAMLGLAAKTAVENDCATAISVPTLALIDQFRAEYENLSKNAPEGFQVPPFHQIFARNEFLSEEKLIDQGYEFLREFKTEVFKLYLQSNPGKKARKYEDEESDETHWSIKLFDQGVCKINGLKIHGLSGVDIAELVNRLIEPSLGGFSHCMGFNPQSALSTANIFKAYGLQGVIGSTHGINAGLCKETLSSQEIALKLIESKSPISLWINEQNCTQTPEILLSKLIKPLVDFIRLSFFSSNQNQLDNSWRIDRLKKIVDEGFISTIAVDEELCVDETTSADDPGYIAYKTQSAHISEGPAVVLMTHMMLATDVRYKHLEISRKTEISENLKEITVNLIAQSKLRSEVKECNEEAINITKGLESEILALRREIFGVTCELDNSQKIPLIHHLWIDEAHLFESTMSKAAAENISVRSILRTLQDLCDELGSGFKLLPALGMMKDSIERMCDCAHDENIGSLYSPTGEIESERLSMSLRMMGNALEEIRIPSKKKRASLSSRHLKMFYKLASAKLFIDYILAGKIENRSTFIEFSPVKRYPQISRGASNVSYLMLWMYSRYRSVCLVSATLYLPDGQSDSPWYMQRILGIPDSLLTQYPPLSPTFLKKPFSQVRAPSEALMKGKKLYPPSSSKLISESERMRQTKEWLIELANEIESIFKTSVGSLLVLNTSYLTVQGLSLLLGQSLQGVELVVASSDKALSIQRKEFLEKASKKRCIWLAVGGAWTGLDVGGHSLGIKPEFDDLLTDLVITRMPFRINKSITHLHRMKTNSSINWEIYEMLFLLRQGLGRLVRVSGLNQNRRIHLLDSRVHKHPKAIEVMKKFPNFKFF